MEDNLNKKLDGLKNDFEHKWDNLQDSIENLIDQQQCPPEEECQSDTMVEEQCQQQPHQGLIEDFIELSEGLFESSNMCAVVFPREKKEEILLFITDEGSGKETAEEPQELVLNPFPTNNPLPVAPSTDQVYILLTPEAYQHLKHHLQRSPHLHCLGYIILGSSWPLLKHLPLHQRHWQLLILHLIVDGANNWFRFGAPGPQQFYQLHQFL